ncbi:MAG: alpha/beta hydrolase [Candidatus Latescibacteria bacterium]|jgi:acetyl esterase/lipase|nr:alpha/beta hydrolase [Candidatus Latescibacterota bacterium]
MSITNNDKRAAELVQKTEIWPSETRLPEGVEQHEHIEENLNDAQLDVTYFTRTNTTELRPAIVFIHGGSWKHGDKKQFYRQAAYLAAKHNIFGVCIEYRLSGVAKFPAALEDCKCAIRWTRSVAEKFQIDTNRIGICGGSAGAHLSALAATTNGVDAYEGKGPYQSFSSRVHLAILYNGHFDMNDQLKDHVQDQDMYDFFGGHPWEIPEIYGAASPFIRVCKDTPPMLFLHGDQDHYPHRQSISMGERLTHYGVYSEVEIYIGKGHAWFNREPDNQTTTERMTEFVEKIFKL